MTDMATSRMHENAPLSCPMGVTVLAPALPWRFTSRDVETLARCMDERDRRGLNVPTA